MAMAWAVAVLLASLAAAFSASYGLLLYLGDESAAYFSPLEPFLFNIAAGTLYAGVLLLARNLPWPFRWTLNGGSVGFLTVLLSIDALFIRDLIVYRREANVEFFVDLPFYFPVALLLGACLGFVGGAFAALIKWLVSSRLTPQRN